MRRLDYEICDVFTERALTGNALAVFTDATALDDVTLQALAREVNLSETAFVLPATDAEADARLRIFTPTLELAFAGHPTLGAAFILSRTRPERAELRLETGRGTVAVRWTARGEGTAFGWMLQLQPIPVREAFPRAEPALSALGVEVSPREAQPTPDATSAPASACTSETWTALPR